jgi:hypothetical protein
MAQPPRGFSRSLNSEPYLPFAGDFQCRKCLCAYAQNAGGETSLESVKMARQAGAIIGIETRQESVTDSRPELTAALFSGSGSVRESRPPPYTAARRAGC